MGKIVLGLFLPLVCLATSITPWTNPLVKPTGAWKAWRTPEADMPGFVPRSRGRCEYRP